MARPEKQEIALSELERKTLLELTRSRVTPHGLVRRAEIVLAICRWRDEHDVQLPISLNGAHPLLRLYSQRGSSILHREIISPTQEVKVLYL